jgi:hypothetical protein
MKYKFVVIKVPWSLSTTPELPRNNGRKPRLFVATNYCTGPGTSEIRVVFLSVDARAPCLLLDPQNFLFWLSPSAKSNTINPLMYLHRIWLTSHTDISRYLPEMVNVFRLTVGFLGFCVNPGSSEDNFLRIR